MFILIIYRTTDILLYEGVCKKINDLLENKGFTVYKLSKETGISKTTFTGSKGVISKSVSEANVYPSHNITVKKSFYGIVDVGGIAALNSGEINSSMVSDKAKLKAYANAEEKIGGICGTNDTNAIIKTSYSYATFEVGCYSSSERVFIGGLVGLNNATITYSYAVINSISFLAFAKGSDCGRFGGLFGNASSSSTVISSFVKINVAAPENAIAFYMDGLGDTPTVLKCHAYLTNANNYTNSNSINVCQSEADLFTTITNLGFDLMGYTVRENNYPIFEGIGYK